MLTCMKTVCLALLGLLTCQACLAEEPPQPPEPYRAEPAQPMPAPDVPFADVLKDLAVKNLPHDIVFEKNDNWGHQANVPTLHGVKIVEVLRNHGNWQKMRAVCQDVPHTIQLRVRDLHYGPDRVACTVQVLLPTTLEYDHKTWQNGIQVHSTHARARVAFKAIVGLEAKIKFDGKGEVTSEAVTDLRVTSAHVVCSYFVSEKVNGVGGDIAKLMDGKVERAFNDWKPAVQRDLQVKVRQAVLLAGQTPRASLVMARTVNDISAQAAAAALHPAFSSATGPAEPPVYLGPNMIQVEPAIGSGLSVFIDLKLNGGSEHARASANAPEHHAESTYHFEHSSSSSSSESSSSHESHADHSRRR